MPEGHTLFRIARALDRAFVGEVVRVTSPQGRFADGAALLDGRRVAAATSRGKHLWVELEGGLFLHVHLGLIGTFTVDSQAFVGEVRPVGAVRCRIETASHVAELRGPMVCEVVTAQEVASQLDRLGPDPLRETGPESRERAYARMARSAKSVAELLMDQTVVAGVGNVYRSEVLFRHRVNPFTPGRQLRRESWGRIWDDLVRLLPLGVATGRIVTVEDEVLDVESRLAAGEDVTLPERTSAVYRRAGEACWVCGARIRTQVVAGRNLFWCGRCQRRH